VPDPDIHAASHGEPGPHGFMNRHLSLLFCLATLLAAPACTSTRYMGLSMVPGETAPEVQALAQRAQAGDKQAQLDLGIRFEEGNGVPRDIKRTMKLYRQAASDSGGMMWVYSPSPGGGAPARVTPVDKGPRQAGLDEAKRKLCKIRSRL